MRESGLKPVSILTNRSNSNVSLSNEKEKDEVGGRCGLPGHPKFVPLETAVRDRENGHLKSMPKLHLVTKMNSEREPDDLSGSARSALTGTSVSFTVPQHQDKAAVHRRSISTKPQSSKVTSPMSATTPVSLGLTAALGGNSIDVSNGEPLSSITPVDSYSNMDDVTSWSGSSRQNSIHIPGDFIYFDTQPRNSSNDVVPDGHSPHLNGHAFSGRSPSAGSLVDSVHGVSNSNNNSESNLVAAGAKKPTTKKRISEEEPHVPFTELFLKEDDEKIHILIGATGSVATIKVPMIIDKLYKIYGENKVSVQLVLTKHAEHFLKGAKINKEVKIWRDEDEWYGFKRMGDPVLHTELRKWADIFLIAPMSANTLAKLANGVCDNLLTCLVRAWKSVPIIIAPAMNTFMYIHPVTKKHLKILQEDYPYMEVLKPVEKVLVCGDIGMGGMREWNEIVDILTKRIQMYRDDIKAQEEEEDDDDDDDDEDEDNDDDDDDDDDDEDDDDDDDEDEESTEIDTTTAK